ncbi:MAG: hypothetical protein SGI92_02805, partial [Bryobacteraceae bacterium]|nr:hypothetical protein [Bryobacteraceae bacterium]
WVLECRGPEAWLPTSSGTGRTGGRQRTEACRDIKSHRRGRAGVAGWVLRRVDEMTGEMVDFLKEFTAIPTVLQFVDAGGDKSSGSGTAESW